MKLHLVSVLVLMLRGRMRVDVGRSPFRRWAVPVVYTVSVVVWVWRRRAVARDAALLPGEHVRLSPAPVFVSDTRAPASPSAEEAVTSADETAALADEPTPATVEGEAVEDTTSERTSDAVEGATSVEASDAEEEPAAPNTPDDLTVIEGIGPRINEVLHAAGVVTLAQLADADPDHLRQILRDANLNLADPETWPAQARYAAEGDMDGLAAYTSTLRGGRAE